MQRLIEIVQVWKGGKQASYNFGTARQQNLSAATAHILLDCDGARSCTRCAKSNSIGPFSTCVYNPEKDVFKGACTQCQYHGFANKCSLVQSGK